MSQFDRIQQKLSKSYSELDRLSGTTTGLTPTTDPGMLVRHWGHIAIDFLHAAQALDTLDQHFFRPTLQLAGHGIECSLKAFLAGASVEPPRQHDLVVIAKLCEEHGMVISESDAAAIVHVNHFYASDLSTGTRFKARYPTALPERWGGTVPAIAMLEELSWSAIEQACKLASVSNAFSAQVLAQYRENISKIAQQDGAVQSATRSESNSECGDKPQLESEGRSR